MGNGNDSIQTEGQVGNKNLGAFGFLEASNTRGNSILKRGKEGRKEERKKKKIYNMHIMCVYMCVHVYIYVCAYCVCMCICVCIYVCNFEMLF